jgi:protoheme IX farnesyltransferase
MPHALLLFLIIFAWTPPHFWALAIARRHDYARADIPMLPVTHGVEFTRLHVLLYTVILCVVTLLPFMIGMSGLIYLAAALVLNARFFGRRSR